MAIPDITTNLSRRNALKGVGATVICIATPAIARTDPEREAMSRYVDRVTEWGKRDPSMTPGVFRRDGRIVELRGCAPEYMDGVASRRKFALFIEELERRGLSHTRTT